jgi:SAM-dependent methyltransferase
LVDPTLEFYDALAADYHLIFQDWTESVRRQGEVLDRLIRTERPNARSVLDCACGIGTQAIGLAARGYRVHATDLSPAAAARANREARAAGATLTTGVADLRTLASDVAGVFDVVLACDNALPHLLTDDDLGQAVRGMARKLRPDGLFLASVRDYDRLAAERPPGELPRSFADPTGRRIVVQVWEWAPDGRTYRLELFILRQAGNEWRTTRHTAEYRALLRTDLERALRDEAGLTAIRWHMPDRSGYYQPIVTARKE